jgi:hypothetical protein
VQQGGQHLLSVATTKEMRKVRTRTEMEILRDKLLFLHHGSYWPIWQTLLGVQRGPLVQPEPKGVELKSPRLKW